MTQTPASGNGATPEPGQPATGTPPEPDGTSGTKLPQSIDDALTEVKRLQDALKKANAEAAGHRHKLKGFEDAQAKLDAEKLTKEEQLTKQSADLQSRYDTDTTALTERIVGYEVQLAAVKLGIVDPDAAARLIDWDALEFGEDGMPTNVTAVLRELLKNKPYLAGKTQPTSGGATNPSRTQSSGVGEITMGNLSEAMSRYNELSDAQKQQVQRLLINRR